jgi:transposase
VKKKRRGAGRPKPLHGRTPDEADPELADDLTLLLAAGASPARAARALGVGERSVRRWLGNGLRDRVVAARASRPESTDALSEARLVVLIARAAQDDWRAVAWLLERRHPERWADHDSAAPRVRPT